MSGPGAPLPIVVLISGRGSNLRAIVESIHAGRLNAVVRAVFSDRADAAGLAYARSQGIPAAHLAPRDFADRGAFEAALAERIDAYAPAVVVLAGFMRILGAGFTTHYAGRMLNIHPSLLPKYRGLHTHRRVLEAGEPEHGASVHFVTAELDGGPVVLQGRVAVNPGDDETLLAERVLAVEHRILPRALAWLADGRLECRAGSVFLDGAPLCAPQAQEEGHA
jgi:phosphoribosylglycinamide formyltransferase-1